MKIRYALPALAAATALVLTGCVNNAESEGGGDSESAAGIEPDQAAVDLLPEEIRESSVLRLATDAEYPPNEY